MRHINRGKKGETMWKNIFFSKKVTAYTNLANSNYLLINNKYHYQNAKSSIYIIEMKFSPSSQPIILNN